MPVSVVTGGPNPKSWKSSEFGICLTSREGERVGDRYILILIFVMIEYFMYIPSGCFKTKKGPMMKLRTFLYSLRKFYKTREKIRTCV